MKQTIVWLIWVVVAVMPTLNAQQASPSQTTATQQTPKPRESRGRAFAQPGVHPVATTTDNNNAGHNKRAGNNFGHDKTADDSGRRDQLASNDPGQGTTAENKPRRDKKPDRNPGKTTTANNDYADVMRRCVRERHDQVWWKRRHVVIVLVGGGYYYWDSGYWCPAWGYDPNYERYDYNGPIYTYGNLLPDQVVINVQHELKELGYYDGPVNGSLGANTRQALTAYQADNELEPTGAVDEATVRALGLI